jgi:hypothetical protein
MNIDIISSRTEEMLRRANVTWKFDEDYRIPDVTEIKTVILQMLKELSFNEEVSGGGIKIEKFKDGQDLYVFVGQIKL